MLNRAYSILHCKSVDDEQRIIEGIATTPTPDRLGDIVEPLGMKYALPMPLLLYHDNERPVGSVEFAKATKNGIPFRASLPKVEEPGIIKDRVDEAWHSLKYRLIGAVSIGFRILDDAVERLKDGGLRFNSTEWLELSLVTVPANQDAKISVIKSIDTALRAASGQTQRVVRLDSPAGVTAKKSGWSVRSDSRDGYTTYPRIPITPQEGKSMKVSEQVTSFEAKRMASSERMEAIMAKAAEDGRTLDEAESEEYDGLETEVKSVDGHLVRLRSLESAQAAKAKPVQNIKSVDEGSRSRESHYVTVESPLPKGIEFARYVRCLAAARGSRGEALEIAKSRYADNPRIITVLKAAVAAGTTTDATWAGPFVEYQTLVSEFVDFLRPQTVIGRFGTNGIPSLRQVPFNVRMLGQTSGGEGYWVGQGAPKPLTQFDFNAVTLGFAKVANIAVITEELARFSNPSADAIVRQELANALIQRLDIDFIDPAKGLVSNVSPASITNGITPVVSSGILYADVVADVTAVFNAFIAANLTPTSGVWIMSGGTALQLSLMQNPLGQPQFNGLTMMGGTFMGLPVITTEHVPNDTSGSLLILVNANDIFLADDGQVVVSASSEASLEMDNAPTNNSATATGTSMVSMYQTNSIALKAERFINWQRRRDAAVQYVDNVNYSATGATV